MQSRQGTVKQYFTLSWILFLLPLFLLMGELAWEPVPDLGQESLYLGTKGSIDLFLALICAVKVPHQQIEGFNITLYYGKLFDYCVQWDIGSHVMNCISSSPPQGALYSFPQTRITLCFSECLVLIAPLLKGNLSLGPFPTES